VRRTADVHRKWCEQVRDDVVIVARVERDVVTPRLDDRPDDINCLIPIERRDLYRPHARDLGEFAPKPI